MTPARQRYRRDLAQSVPISSDQPVVVAEHAVPIKKREPLLDAIVHAIGRFAPWVTVCAA